MIAKITIKYTDRYKHNKLIIQNLNLLIYLPTLISITYTTDDDHHHQKMDGCYLKNGQ